MYLYGIYIKDKSTLEDFLAGQALETIKYQTLIDYTMSDYHYQQIYGNSLVNLNKKFHKAIDDIFDKYTEEQLRDLPLKEQKELVGKAVAPRLRRIGVNYSQLVPNQYVRTQVIKASDIGVTTLKKAKKFKTWNSYFDDLVRPTISK